MVFSSLIFLYAFFSISLLAYSLCRTQKAQNVVLLIFSLFFYAWGEPKYVLLLMFMSLVSWACAWCVDDCRKQWAKRVWVAIAAVVDIGLIGYFKYAGLICSIFGEVPAFVQNILLPIGISFYTFQLLTYVVDVYRGDAEVQNSYWNVLLYASLFHQCVAGPIVRYKTIDEELFSGQRRQPEWAEGVSRFSFGLAKKVLLANPCGALAESLILSESYAADVAAAAVTIGELPVLGAWAGLIAYGMQICLDFSA
jgi:alginate O-acetyltransferase complex protein AlgI